MSSSISLNTREISDIFHFAAMHFLPERHSAMVLIYIYMYVHMYSFFLYGTFRSRVRLLIPLTVRDKQNISRWAE